MQKYTALVKHAAPEMPEGFHDIYLANDADGVMAGASQALNAAKARIRELEKRLVACESAMLVGCDTSHRAIVGYMQTYPDPYSGS